ncbi:MAG: hypothetical protein Crog4KO_36860 [Crocinitomicaceae bacterium]
MVDESTNQSSGRGGAREEKAALWELATRGRSVNTLHGMSSVSDTVTY